MTYQLKYIILAGFNPDGHPIVVPRTSDFNSLTEINEWMLTNMMPSSIWWISYQILCDGSLVEEKRNPNLSEDLRSR